MSPYIPSHGQKFGLRQKSFSGYQQAPRTKAIPKQQKLKRAIITVSATVSVDTGDGGETTRTNAPIDLLDTVEYDWGDRDIPLSLSGRELLAVQRRLTAQEMRLEDGGFDPSSQGNYDLYIELELPYVLPFMADSFGFHHPGADVGEAFDITVDLADDQDPAGTANSEGTGIMTDGAGNTLEMSWATEPTVEVTFDTAGQMGPLPIAHTQWQVVTGDQFTAQNDSYILELRGNEPILAIILMTAEDINTYWSPADLINTVSVGGRKDFSDVPIEVLEYRERRDFDAVSHSQTGELGILMADGGLWTGRARPRHDFEENIIELDVQDPNTDPARVKAIVVRGIRRPQDIGSTVRQTLAPQPASG